MDDINFEKPFNDVKLTDLKIIPNPKGDLYHVLKASDADYKEFGEAYITTINKNEIKGWKKHKKMTMNLVVPVGNVLFYIKSSESNLIKEFNLGEDAYGRLKVGPGYWVAFKGISSGTNLILNVASIEHDPNESESLPLDTFSMKIFE